MDEKEANLERAEQWAQTHCVVNLQPSLRTVEEAIAAEFAEAKSLIGSRLVERIAAEARQDGSCFVGPGSDVMKRAMERLEAAERDFERDGMSDDDSEGFSIDGALDDAGFYVHRYFDGWAVYDKIPSDEIAQSIYWDGF